MSKPVPAFLSGVSVEGTSNNDEIEVKIAAGKLKGFVNGAVVLSRPVDDCRSSGFSPEAAFVLRVNGNGGDDTITVDIGSATDCRCEIRGGEGNDEMWVAGCKGGTANGDGGDDAISIVGKSLDVDGGEGNDINCFHD